MIRMARRRGRGGKGVREGGEEVGREAEEVAHVPQPRVPASSLSPNFLEKE